MKYDNQYYTTTETGSAAEVMLAGISPEGFGKKGATLHSSRSIADAVGDHVMPYVISEGDKEGFEPCDFHETPHPLFSQKLRNVIAKINPYKVDLYPCTLTNDINVWGGYYAMHVWQELACMHRERSIYRQKRRLCFIDELSLDETMLDRIPEHERLIFVLEEKWMILYHQKVVDAIMATNPTGIKFIPVSGIHPGMAFDD